MNKSDGHYHVMDDNGGIVYMMLNEEVKKKGYGVKWDRNLYLGRVVVVRILSPVNVYVRVLSGTTLEECGVPSEVFGFHLMPKGTTPTTASEYVKTTVVEEDVELVPYHKITLNGEVDKTVYVEADGIYVLGDNSELKKYFDSKNYVVGDSDKNSMLNEKTIVTGDLNIVVMKQNMVVIDMEESTVLAVDVDLKEIAESISALTGIDVGSIFVDVEIDDNGYVLRIIVILKDEEMSEEVVASINDLAKDSQCGSGVLCHSSSARIVVGDMSSSFRVFSFEYIVLSLALIISFVELI